MYEVESQGQATVLANRDEPWAILFYSPKCTRKECRNAQKEWKAVAKVEDCSSGRGGSGREGCCFLDVNF